MMEDQERLKRLELMANELRDLQPNNNTYSLRQAALTSGGYDFADTLHNIYLDYGYPAQLEFKHFWNMYRRFGIAANVINFPVTTCWSSVPKIESDRRVVEAIDRLHKKIKLWDRIKGLDSRQRVGRYAGMFMRVRDNKNPKEPLNGTFNEASLIEMMPLYESQLEVITSETDAKKDNYGQPILLQYTQGVVGSRNEEAKQTIQIHASRVVFAAEGADNGWIYGIPALEPIYNSLMDLRKIIGGGAEGFYKNSSQTTVFNLKDAASASAYADKLKKFNQEYDEFVRDRSRRAMWTPGMEAKTLESNLVSPKDFFDVALNDVAAGSGIPATILIGKQTGRLASEEDSEHFLNMNQSRRENFCTELVENIISWLMKYGILAQSDFEVEWDDLLARSDSEKLSNAEKMAGINKKQFDSGTEAPFSADEIREAAGYEDQIEPDGLDLPEGDDGEEDA